MSNRQKQLVAFSDGLQQLGKEAPDILNAFTGMQDAVFSPGVLDIKTKHLLGVAICCENRYKYLIVHHISEALKAGASRQEIIEAAMVSVAFGCGSSLAYAATALKETLDEFGAV